MPSRRFPSGCIISHLSTAVKSDGSPVLPYDIYSCCNGKKKKKEITNKSQLLMNQRGQQHLKSPTSHPVAHWDRLVFIIERREIEREVVGAGLQWRGRWGRYVEPTKQLLLSQKTSKMLSNDIQTGLQYYSSIYIPKALYKVLCD